MPHCESIYQHFHVIADVIKFLSRHESNSFYGEFNASSTREFYIDIPCTHIYVPWLLMKLRYSPLFSTFFASKDGPKYPVKQIFA